MGAPHSPTVRDDVIYIPPSLRGESTFNPIPAALYPSSLFCFHFRSAHFSYGRGVYESRARDIEKPPYFYDLGVEIKQYVRSS